MNTKPLLYRHPEYKDVGLGWLPMTVGYNEATRANSRPISGKVETTQMPSKLRLIGFAADRSFSNLGLFLVTASGSSRNLAIDRVQAPNAYQHFQIWTLAGMPSGGYTPARSVTAGSTRQKQADNACCNGTDGAASLVQRAQLWISSRIPI